MLDGPGISNGIVRDTVGGMVGGVVSLHTRRALGFEDQVNYGNIAADSFGNALGNAAVSGIRVSNERSELSAEARQAYNLLRNEGVPHDAAMGLLRELPDAMMGDNGALLLNQGGPAHDTLTSSKLDLDQLSAAQHSAYDKAESQSLSQGMSPQESRLNAENVARLAAITEAIDARWQSVEGLSSSDPQRQRMEYIRFAFANAMIAKDVYFDQGISELLPTGYVRLSDDQALSELRLTKAHLDQNASSGYFAAACG